MLLITCLSVRLADPWPISPSLPCSNLRAAKEHSCGHMSDRLASATTGTMMHRGRARDGCARARRSDLLQVRTSMCVTQPDLTGEVPKEITGQGGFPACPPIWRRFLQTTGRERYLIVSDKRSRMREIFDLELEIAGGFHILEHGLCEADKQVSPTSRGQPHADRYS